MDGVRGEGWWAAFGTGETDGGFRARGRFWVVEGILKSCTPVIESS